MYEKMDVGAFAALEIEKSGAMPNDKRLVIPIKILSSVED